MPSIKNIRFQKLDDYQNFIFIANSKKEPKLYKKLSKFYKQLAKKYAESFLPVYENKTHNYATIRLKKDYKISKLKLLSGDVVNIEFVVRKRVNEDGKVSVKCYVDTIKLVSRAPPVDLGDELSFSDEESEADDPPSPPSLSKSIVDASNTELEDEFGSRGW